jgi:hypothetical protein
MRPLLRAAHSEGCWLRGRVELHARCAAWAVLGCARGAAGGAPSFEEAAACAVVVVSAVRRLARVARAAERVAGGVVRAARRRATRRRRVREAHADAAGRCSARAPSTPCASARRHAGGPKRAHRGGREPIFGASSQVTKCRTTRAGSIAEGAHPRSLSSPKPLTPSSDSTAARSGRSGLPARAGARGCVRCAARERPEWSEPRAGAARRAPASGVCGAMGVSSGQQTDMQASALLAPKVRPHARTRRTCAC